MIDLDFDIPDLDIVEPTDLGTACNITILAMRLGRWPIVIPSTLEDAERLEDELEETWDKRIKEDWDYLWEKWYEGM